MSANLVSYALNDEAFSWHITVMANSTDEDAIMHCVMTVTASGFDTLG